MFLRPSLPLHSFLFFLKCFQEGCDTESLSSSSPDSSQPEMFIHCSAVGVTFCSPLAIWTLPCLKNCLLR